MSLIRKIYEQAAEVRKHLPAQVSEDLAKFALDYFISYGHVSEKTVANGDSDSIFAAVAKGISWVAQALDERGNVIHSLQAMREIPRCGCPDFIQDEDGLEKLQARWNKRHLKVRIASYVPAVTREAQVENMRKNLHNTGLVCGLTFEMIDDGQADLILHAKKIDGVGRVLGQQWLPDGRDTPKNGELDIADMTDVSKHRRTSLHETCGHGVGCVHINSPGSVMNPYLTSHEIWQKADIEQLQRLYGPSTTPAPQPQPTPTGPTGDILDLRALPNVKQIRGLDGWRFLREG